MELSDTTNPQLVERIRLYSTGLVSEGAATEVKNFDIKSTWHNSKYKCATTGREWVVYLPDNAFGGEVKLLCP
jgi:hypothetical protein